MIKKYLQKTGFSVMQITASDVRKAIAESKKYMNKKGDAYSRDISKNPSMVQFVKIYFGDEIDEYQFSPVYFSCTNRNVAYNLYANILSYLEYFDKFSKNYCEVILDKNTISIVNDSM